MITTRATGGLGLAQGWNKGSHVGLHLSLRSPGIADGDTPDTGPVTRSNNQWCEVGPKLVEPLRGLQRLLVCGIRIAEGRCLPFIGSLQVINQRAVRWSEVIQPLLENGVPKIRCAGGGVVGQ